MIDDDVTTLSEEELESTLSKIMQAEKEYRSRGFERIADGYLPDIDKYNRKLTWLRQRGNVKTSQKEEE